MHEIADFFGVTFVHIFQKKRAVGDDLIQIMSVVSTQTDDLPILLIATLLIPVRKRQNHRANLSPTKIPKEPVRNFLRKS